MKEFLVSGKRCEVFLCLFLYDAYYLYVCNISFVSVKNVRKYFLVCYLQVYSSMCYAL